MVKQLVISAPKIDITPYKHEYGFGLEPRPTQDTLNALREAYKKEMFQKRKQVIGQELARTEMITELQCDFIQLPIVMTQDNQGRYFVVEDQKLFAGGLEEYIRASTSYRPTQQQQYYGQTWIVMRSLYIGPLPEWVAAKYKTALKYFEKDQIIVVSRHRPFFDIQEEVVRIEPIRQLSPLLVAFGRKQYLLAAWGLEYERQEIEKDETAGHLEPKSGGVLS